MTTEERTHGRSHPICMVTDNRGAQAKLDLLTASQSCELQQEGGVASEGEKAKESSPESKLASENTRSKLSQR